MNATRYVLDPDHIIPDPKIDSIPVGNATCIELGDNGISLTIAEPWKEIVNLEVRQALAVHIHCSSDLKVQTVEWVFLARDAWEVEGLGIACFHVPSSVKVINLHASAPFFLINKA